MPVQVVLPPAPPVQVPVNCPESSLIRSPLVGVAICTPEGISALMLEKNVFTNPEIPMSGVA